MTQQDPLTRDSVLSDLRELRSAAARLGADSGASCAAQLDAAILKLQELGRRTEHVHNSQSQLLAEVTAVLSNTHLSEVLQCIVDAAIRLVGAERGFVMFLGDSGRLEFAAARNMDRSAVTSPAGEVSRNIVSHVMESGETACLTDATSVQPFAEAESVTRLRLQSVLAVPLQVDGRTLGALYVENRHVSGVFTEADRRVIEAFAQHIATALRNAQTMGELRRTRDELQNALGERGRFPGVVGHSPAFLSVLDTIVTAARSDLAVLIEGESGTGKELLARTVHASSDRAEGPLVAANCAALPAPLLESELFGHVRGAFTGAAQDRKGLFATANRGTLFLDEVGEMPLPLQAKLLRVLQSGEFRRLGSDTVSRVDVRIVAATQQDLAKEVEAGRFRQDLFYRLNGVRVRVPPLRERREDVLLMAEHFLRSVPGAAERPISIHPDARLALVSYDYPGNVRELENIIRRAAVFASGGIIEPQHLPKEVVAGVQLALGRGEAVRHIPRNADELRETKALARREAAERVESLFLVETLRAAGGNVSLAAQHAGMNRSQFQQMLSRHGRKAADFRET